MKKRPIQFGGGIFPGQDINTFIKVAIVGMHCIQGGFEFNSEGEVSSVYS